MCINYLNELLISELIKRYHLYINTILMKY